MGVITDGDSFEKIVIFGGIQNVVKDQSQRSLTESKDETSVAQIDAG